MAATIESVAAKEHVREALAHFRETAAMDDVIAEHKSACKTCCGILKDVVGNDDMSDDDEGEDTDKDDSAYVPAADYAAGGSGAAPTDYGPTADGEKSGSMIAVKIPGRGLVVGRVKRIPVFSRAGQPRGMGVCLEDNGFLVKLGRVTITGLAQKAAMSKASVVKCMKCLRTSVDLANHKSMPRAGKMCMRAAAVHLKAALGVDENSDANPGIDPLQPNAGANGEPNPGAGTGATAKHVTVESLVRAVWAAPFTENVEPYLDRERVEKNIKQGKAAVITDAVADEVNARLGACALVGRPLTEAAALNLALEAGFRRKEAEERCFRQSRGINVEEAEFQGIYSMRRHESGHAVMTACLTNHEIAEVKITKDYGVTRIHGLSESADVLGKLAVMVAGLATDYETVAAGYHSGTNPIGPQASDTVQAVKLARQVLLKAGKTTAAARLNENNPDTVALALVDEMVAAVRAVLPKHARVTDAIDRVAVQIHNNYGQIGGAVVTKCVNESLQRSEFDTASIVEEKKKFRADVVGALQRALGLPVR
jgi:hypothetical protein